MVRNFNNGFLIAFFFLLFSASLSYAATYYVRTDGGSATECTGLADTAYSGSGTNQSCAFKHPFWALSVPNAPNRMVGGDTLIIGPGEYMMGYGAPNTPGCSPSYPWDCSMRAVPSGTSANPTRILGKGWDSGCSSKPQLWGTERSANIFDLRGSSNVEIQCLEITDHSSCMDSGPDPATVCNRDTYPFGQWAMVGLVAADSENVLLKNLNIHGLRTGVFAGRIKDWTIEKTDIIANSFVGWDGDTGATTSSNSGTIRFNDSRIMYSGCGETYPGLLPHHCYSQDQGGYGDGLGTNKTGGDWVFDHVDVSYNVSDGIDLLYHNGNGAITISHSRFEGNAGNQIKVATSSVIDNSKVIGTCAFFLGKSFTSATGVGGQAVSFNNCRAGGNTIAAAFHAGMLVAIYNSTITSHGDVIVQTSGSNCLSSDKVISSNNIYIGGSEYNSGGGDVSDLYYASGTTGNGDGTCGSLAFVTANDLIWGTKYNNLECSGTTSRCIDPQIAGTIAYSSTDVDVSLLSSSPAITTGLVISGIPTTDYNNYDRGTIWDIGALEYGSTATTAGSSSSPVVVPTSVTPPPAPSTPPSSGSSGSGSSGSSSGSSSSTSGSSGGSTAGTGSSTGSSSSGSSSASSTSSASSDSTSSSSSSASSSTTSSSGASTSSSLSSSSGGSSSGGGSSAGSSSGSSGESTTSAGGSFADAFTPPVDGEEKKAENPAPKPSYRSRVASAPATGSKVTQLVSAVIINQSKYVLMSPNSNLPKAGVGRKGKRSGWWTKN